jgi:uncharacterized protein (DUF169 family)
MPASVIRRRLYTVAAWLTKIALCLMIFFPMAEMQAYAVLSNLRCDKGIVSHGERQFDVLMKCGEPTYRSIKYEKRIKRDLYRDLFPPRDLRESEKYREPLFVEELAEVEEWVYNLGSLQFVRYLTFENGILVNIELGGYGY